MVLAVFVWGTYGDEVGRGPGQIQMTMLLGHERTGQLCLWQVLGTQNIVSDVRLAEPCGNAFGVSVQLCDFQLKGEVQKLPQVEYSC